MQQDLSNLGTDRSREFLDYFNAALRSKNDVPFPPSGSGRFTASGYEALFSDWIETIDGGGVAVTWKLLLKPDGTAVSVEAVCDSGAPSHQWEPKASEFVRNILVLVLSGKKSSFFKRRHFAAIFGSNLKGEYWLPGYRFAPQFPEDDCTLINSERFLVIDQEVKAIDSWHADELADERAALASAHLSLIADVGLYKPIHEHRWFLSREEGTLRQHRESTQHMDLNIPSKMPRKGELCPGVKFEGSVF